eukprot:TRINITY_DN68067_c0_g1_i1.p1 TRINITY_DN68067_c0_g1~~TRINITY_DN68067_c0_g1_i1.p1  ORF type:complete len:655 (+),score=87.22 TRINITY_DN68067_c0_g1_i1:253-2217(+)
MTKGRWQILPSLQHPQRLMLLMKAGGGDNNATNPERLPLPKEEQSATNLERLPPPNKYLGATWDEAQPVYLILDPKQEHLEVKDRETHGMELLFSPEGDGLAAKWRKAAAISAVSPVNSLSVGEDVSGRAGQDGSSRVCWRLTHHPTVVRLQLHFDGIPRSGDQLNRLREELLENPGAFNSKVLPQEHAYVDEDQRQKMLTTWNGLTEEEAEILEKLVQLKSPFLITPLPTGKQPNQKDWTKDKPALFPHAGTTMTEFQWPKGEKEHAQAVLTIFATLFYAHYDLYKAGWLHADAHKDNTLIQKQTRQGKTYFIAHLVDFGHTCRLDEVPLDRKERVSDWADAFPRDGSIRDNVGFLPTNFDEWQTWMCEATKQKLDKYLESKGIDLKPWTSSKQPCTSLPQAEDPIDPPSEQALRALAVWYDDTTKTQYEDFLYALEGNYNPAVVKKVWTTATDVRETKVNNAISAQAKLWLIAHTDKWINHTLMYHCFRDLRKWFARLTKSYQVTIVAHNVAAEDGLAVLRSPQLKTQVDHKLGKSCKKINIDKLHSATDQNNSFLMFGWSKRAAELLQQDHQGAANIKFIFYSAPQLAPVPKPRSPSPPPTTRFSVATEGETEYQFSDGFLTTPTDGNPKPTDENPKPKKQKTGGGGCDTC